MISTLSMGANREDQGPNKTPGDDVGSDHTGFSFNCYQFAGTGDAEPLPSTSALAAARPASNMPSVNMSRLLQEQMFQHPVLS